MQLHRTDWYFPFLTEQRKLFIKGSLVRNWHARYPFLFDTEDFRLARSQPQYHFFERLAAILLYHATGCYSLVVKYGFPAHSRKQEVIRKLHSRELDQGLALQSEPGLPQPQICWSIPETRRTGSFAK